MGGIGPDAREAIPDLLAFLKVSDAYSRVFAAWALWRIDPVGQTATATQVLAAAVTDSFNTGLNAIRALDQMDQVQLAVPPLVEVLKAADKFNRTQAANLLARIGPDASPAVQALIVALQDREFQVRLAAARASGSIPKPAPRCRCSGLPSR